MRFEPGSRELILEACEIGHYEAVDDYIRMGVSVHTTDVEETTGLMLASRSGHYDVVQLLLDERAKVNHSNRYGDSALTGASSEGHLWVAKLLLQYGADANSRNIHGNSPLMLAVGRNHNLVVRLLLDAAAEVNSENRIGETPLGLAKAHGNREVAALLIKAGAVECLNQDYPSERLAPCEADAIYHIGSLMERWGHHKAESYNMGIEQANILANLLVWAEEAEISICHEQSDESYRSAFRDLLSRWCKLEANNIRQEWAYAESEEWG